MREIKFRVLYNGKMVVKSLNDILVDSTSNFMFLSAELMQYTDFKDMQDVEIYEGDIIEIRGTHYDTRREPVIFDTDMHAFMAGGRFLTDFGKYFSLEVIGNVYEHPELLEKAGN